MGWARAAALLAAAPALAWGLGADMMPAAQDRAVELSSSIVDIPPEAGGQHDRRVLVFGSGGPPDLPGVSVRSQHGFFSVATVEAGAVPALRARGHTVIADFLVEFDGAPALGPPGSVGPASLTYTGSGSTVAIVDTGVDFSNPDLRGSLARDSRNHPVMLDSDGQGIVITNATFHARIDQDSILRNRSGPLPENATSGVYRSADGVFLDVERGGQGTTIWVYNSFYPQAGEEPVFEAVLNDDMKIGASHRDYIRSLSGIYHLGVAYQGSLSGSLASLQLVPVLVTDPNVAGVYDTVTADLSTSWGDFAGQGGGDGPDLDFDFTDERPVVLGSGNEFLVYDSDGDGEDDYSAGALGARVLDVYGVINRNATALIHDAASAVNGTLLPPIDPGGNFVGLMTDFEGHGTASAGAVASAGKMSYDLYGNGTAYSVTGSAPGASILPVKSIWFGDTVYAWLWTAGFDNSGSEWEFSGSPRADIISNSWGVSHFPDLGAPPGLDVLSLVMTALSTPGSLDDDYPGVLMVTSAGNSGPGYGTLGAPNASPMGLSVGASTVNDYVGHGQFKGQPRFGNSTAHSGHLVDFSSRGPGVLGDPKPDIVAPGAYSFVPASVLRFESEPDAEPFSLFGGTSMAAPLVAGAAAVLLEGLRDSGMDSDPLSIKNILLSTARDMGNDPYSQGSGLYDPAAALGYVSGSGPFSVHNDASYTNVRSALEGALARTNSTELQLPRFWLPPSSLQMTPWYGGHVEPGGTSAATFTVANTSSEPVEVSVSAVRPGVLLQTSAGGTTEPRVAPAGADADSDAYEPGYVPLSRVREYADLGSFYEPVRIPAESDMMVLNVSFGMDQFMDPESEVYADDLSIASVYIYDWDDRDGDGRADQDELAMVSRGGSWGTVQELRLSDPASSFSGVPLVGVYPVPERFSYWTGATGEDSDPMDYEITATFYGDAAWDAVWVERGALEVPAGGTAQLSASIKVPPGAPTGAYQGFLEFAGGGHSARVPVSYVVAEPVERGSEARVAGSEADGVLHGPGYVKGAFDMASRYMAGDWRQYYFDVRDPLVDSAVIDVRWQDEGTSASVFVASPDGRLISTSTPAGAFGHFMGWPSLDWLGTTPFSEGGGFYPVTTRNATSSVVHVPVNQTGVHSVLVHSTLFGGSSVTEPLGLEARFYGSD